MKPFLNQIMHQTIRQLQQATQRLAMLIQKSSISFSRVALALMFLLLFSLSWMVPAPAYAQPATLTPRQVVEYALTLEKLEADFYRRAIAEAQTGRLSNAPQIAKAALISYGQDEAQHVVDLSTVLRSLGGDPDSVRLPANPNYSAILGRDPFANPTDLLLAGQYVEDLGVAAYKGQVQNLLAAGEAGKAVLAGALEIHSVEARHAAGIRYLRQTLLGANVRPWISDAKSVIYNENRTGSPIPFSSEAFDGYATESEVLALVQPILTPSQSNSAPGQSTQSEDAQADTKVRGLW